MLPGAATRHTDDTRTTCATSHLQNLWRLGLQRLLLLLLTWQVDDRHGCV
jgi:hypothetical protein